MEIGSVNDFLPSFVHPDFLIYGLAAGTAAVTAGIIADFGMSAFRADADVAAALDGLTADDVPCGLVLPVREMREFHTEGVIRSTKNFLYPGIRHGGTLPTGQRD